MRAVLNATGYNPALAPLIHRTPSSLFRVVDKPILIHIIEKLVLLGVQKIDLVLHHLPQLIEEQVQEGRRWGIEVVFHLARDAEAPLVSVIAAAYKWSEEVIILGTTDILPKLQPKQLQEKPPAFFFTEAVVGLDGACLLQKSYTNLIPRSSFLIYRRRLPMRSKWRQVGLSFL